MKINGTIVNYYFHCKRQCYLHANNINLEDNSELVKIGKVIHEINAEKYSQSEISIDNIKIDRITKDYLTEVKKSDADIESARWQTYYYLKVLKDKGIKRKGKLEFKEKNKKESKVEILELTDEIEKELEKYIDEIQKLIYSEKVPEIEKSRKCKKCAYYDYCYIS